MDRHEGGGLIVKTIAEMQAEVNAMDVRANAVEAHIGDTFTFSELPKLTISDTEPENMAHGDIWLEVE